jgi:hypothetical protein
MNKAPIIETQRMTWISRKIYHVLWKINAGLSL